jgi:hypothetical protein
MKRISAYHFSVVLLLMVLISSMMTQAFVVVHPAVPKATGQCNYRLGIAEGEEVDDIQPILSLASAQCASKVLHLTEKIGLKDVLGKETKTVEEIAIDLNNKIDPSLLLDTMRLLESVGILIEQECDDSITFCFTETGLLLMFPSLTIRGGYQ